MRKLLLACLSLAWIGCQEDPALSGPEKPDTKSGSLVSARLDAPAESLAVNETVRLEPQLVFAGEVDTGKVRFNWSITRDGKPVPIGEAAKRILDWIPSKPGTYSARLTVEYGDKTVEIYVIVVISASGGDEAKRLAEIRKGMLGSWKGTVTTPWVAPYTVDMELRGDGTYSARNLTPDPDFRVPALYYGTDEDQANKVWLIDDLKANGDATGEIHVSFGEGNAVRDEIRHLRVSADGSRLSFEMWHFGTYGPVAFELTRAP